MLLPDAPSPAVGSASFCGSLNSTLSLFFFFFPLDFFVWVFFFKLWQNIRADRFSAPELAAEVAALQSLNFNREKKNPSWWKGA